MIKLFHTYKKQKVLFKSIKKDRAKIYCCGPTVYDNITIGNIHKYIMDDTLRRVLEYFGYEVTQVMNITDVGHLTMTDLQKKEFKEKHGREAEVTDSEDGLDRMEKAAKREGVTTWKIAQKYINKIFGKDGDKSTNNYEEGDMGKMNILRPDHLPRATEYIQEMIGIIKILEDKGYTYTTNEAVYFDIQKFEKYEDIVGQSFQQMKKGERADVSDPDRKHPADFRLWQLNRPDHSMQWDSPWGRGYPGWHIECSAMSADLLGKTFDIHTGGEDHIKVHHPAEMAQNEAAFDKKMANYWIHNAFITVNDRKVSKSLGNAYFLDDVIERGFDPLDLRYLYLQTHYRKSLNFTWEGLEGAKNARLKLVRHLKDIMVYKYKESKKRVTSGKSRLEPTKQYLHTKKEIEEAFADDLNMPKALGLVWNTISDDKMRYSEKQEILVSSSKVLGIGLEPLIYEKIDEEKNEKIEELVEKREKAREEKNWKRADEIREKLLDKYGVEVEDREGESVWRKLVG